MGTHENQLKFTLVGLCLGQVHQPEGLGTPYQMACGVPFYGPGDVSAPRHQFFGQPEEVPVRRINELFDPFNLINPLRSLQYLGRRLGRGSGQNVGFGGLGFGRFLGRIQCRCRDRWVNAGISRTGGQAGNQKEKP